MLGHVLDKLKWGELGHYEEGKLTNGQLAEQPLKVDFGTVCTVCTLLQIHINVVWRINGT